MDKIKLGDALKIYDGKEDIEEWLTKFELVCSINKIKDEERVIPLFLEKGALAVYLQLGDETKKNSVTIKQKLREAFGEDPYIAYEKLITKRWEGEQIDLYLTEIKKLTRAAGINDENFIKKAFIVGLPMSISKELRIVKNLHG